MIERYLKPLIRKHLKVATVGAFIGALCLNLIASTVYGDFGFIGEQYYRLTHRDAINAENFGFAELQSADLDLDRGDLDDARTLSAIAMNNLLSSANGGDTKAMIILAGIYYCGWLPFVGKDNSSAAIWQTKAEIAGDNFAANVSSSCAH